MTATAHDHQVPEQLTLKLSPEARESLQWIASQHGGIPLAEVIRKALSTEKFLLEQQASGASVLIEDKSGRLKQVNFR